MRMKNGDRQIAILNARFAPTMARKPASDPGARSCFLYSPELLTNMGILVIIMV